MATNTFGPSALATPANAVTMARILVLPLLVILILDEGSEWPALALWVVLAGSDCFDGWLARRHGATRSGAFLDPLADKFLVIGAMVALVAKGVLWWVPVALMAAREVALSAYRSYVGRRGVSVPARLQAKVKTWVQAVAVGLAIAPVSGDGYQAVAVGLAIAPVTGDAYRTFLIVVLWAAVALTLVTGAQYLWDGRKVVRGL
jgi:CDP-diacylglycerol--glycerol-3-phosphate 3-phosphatidyltransferase